MKEFNLDKMLYGNEWRSNNKGRCADYNERKKEKLRDDNGFDYERKLVMLKNLKTEYETRLGKVDADIAYYELLRKQKWEKEKAKDEADRAEFEEEISGKKVEYNPNDTLMSLVDYYYKLKFSYDKADKRDKIKQ